MLILRLLERYGFNHRNNKSGKNEYAKSYLFKQKVIWIFLFFPFQNIQEKSL